MLRHGGGPLQQVVGRHPRKEEAGHGMEGDARLPDVLLGHGADGGRDGGGEVVHLTVGVRRTLK